MLSLASWALFIAIFSHSGFAAPMDGPAASKQSCGLAQFKLTLVPRADFTTLSKAQIKALSPEAAHEILKTLDVRSLQVQGLTQYLDIIASVCASENRGAALDQAELRGRYDQTMGAIEDVRLLLIEALQKRPKDVLRWADTRAAGPGEKNSTSGVDQLVDLLLTSSFIHFQGGNDEALLLAFETARSADRYCRSGDCIGFGVAISNWFERELIKNEEYIAERFGTSAAESLGYFVHRFALLSTMFEKYLSEDLSLRIFKFYELVKMAGHLIEARDPISKENPDRLQDTVGDIERWLERGSKVSERLAIARLPELNAFSKKELWLTVNRPGTAKKILDDALSFVKALGDRNGARVWAEFELRFWKRYGRQYDSVDQTCIEFDADTLIETTLSVMNDLAGDKFFAKKRWLAVPSIRDYYSQRTQLRLAKRSIEDNGPRTIGDKEVDGGWAWYHYRGLNPLEQTLHISKNANLVGLIDISPVYFDGAEMILIRINTLAGKLSEANGRDAIQYLVDTARVLNKKIVLLADEGDRAFGTKWLQVEFRAAPAPGRMAWIQVPFPEDSIHRLATKFTGDKFPDLRTLEMDLGVGADPVTIRDLVKHPKNTAETELRRSPLRTMPYFEFELPVVVEEYNDFFQRVEIKHRWMIIDPSRIPAENPPGV